MKIMKFFALFAMLVPLSAICDSPVTSTGFYNVYMDIGQVRLAAETGKMDNLMAEFLLDEENPLDQKAALINALSWERSPGVNVETFSMFLGRKYGVPFENIDPSILNGDELFCLGYLKAMADYFDTSPASALLERAKEKNPASFTVNIILAIVDAQYYIGDNAKWCMIWQLCDTVWQNPELSMDMRPEANQVIEEYIGLYKAYCD
ncbi:MAG: hypothetical protein JXA03_07120 [Bacteroidales bacterium]|nr:hypothetical protein [Bacteroidales bacterium]